MKKIKDKSKMYMILGISFLVLAVLGSAYAYYKYVIATINVDTITRGLDYYINYTKGTDITSAALNPGSDYTSGNNLSVTLYKKDNTYTIYGHIYLDISSISANLSNSGALKYAVLEGTTKIADGELTGTSSGNSVPLAVNIPLKTASTKYTVYLWFDKTEENYMSAENTSISATVRCEASMKPIKGTSYGTTGKYFYNKYTPNTKVINNGITYNYDTTNSLMQDIGGNLRYYGASPNNYIYFNCSDYSNQSSSTCEVWRIIGVFDDKVKIVRESSIGAYSWDNKTDGVWSTSSSMKILNPNFTGTNGSTYWNGVSGTCNNGNNTTGTCDFTTSGLKAGTTKSLISNSTWNIGSTTEDYVNVEYNKEIKTTGSFYVGLPNVSDYGYAADLGKCAKQLRNYSDSTCTSNNWMIFLSKGTKKMASLINNYDSNMINIVNESGNVDIFNNDYDDASPLYSYNMFPTLYLTSDAIVDESTKGSSSNPYKIKSPTK